MVSTVGPPLLGNASFAVQAGQTLGSAPVVQLLGFSQTSVPILGINVLVNPAIAPSLVATGVGPGMGQATFPLPIPNVAGFAGASLYAQIVTIDSGAALGLAASDGMQFTLCDQLVLLRDPTCANEPACFEQRGLMSSYKAGTPWAPSAFPLTLSAPTVMTRFVGMGSNGLSVVPWVSLTWTMNVWDSPSAFAASGLAGNIVANTTLAVTHIPVGNPAFLNHQVDMNVASPAGVAPATWVLLREYSLQWNGLALARDSNRPGHRHRYDPIHGRVLRHLQPRPQLQPRKLLHQGLGLLRPAFFECRSNQRAQPQ